LFTPAHQRSKHGVFRRYEFDDQKLGGELRGKFKDLQAANGGEEIKQLDPIDRVPRMLQAPELTDGLPFAADDDSEIPVKVERI